MEPISINNRSYEYETHTRSTMTVGVAVRIIVFLIIGVVTYFAFTNGITLFSWHPTLMLIGVSKWIEKKNRHDLQNVCGRIWCFAAFPEIRWLCCILRNVNMFCLVRCVLFTFEHMLHRDGGLKWIIRHTQQFVSNPSIFLHSDLLPVSIPDDGGHTDVLQW